MKRTVIGLLLLSALLPRFWGPAYPDLFIDILYSSRGEAESGPALYGLRIGHDGHVTFTEYAVRYDMSAIPPKMVTPPILVKRARITSQQAQELAAAIEQADIWAMKDQYGDIPPGPGHEWTATQIGLNGRYKTITHPNDVGCISVYTATPGLSGLCILEYKIWAYAPDLRNKAAMTPTPLPWWQFWNRPIATATP